MGLKDGVDHEVKDQLTSGVHHIFANARAFATVKKDGSVVTWDHQSWGGDSVSVKSELKGGVDHVVANGGAFAAVKHDGSRGTTHIFEASPGSVSSDSALAAKLI